MLEPGISAIGASVGFFVLLVIADAYNRYRLLNTHHILTPYASHM
jgi:hypothetical protein